MPLGVLVISYQELLQHLVSTIFLSETHQLKLAVQYTNDAE